MIDTNMHRLLTYGISAWLGGILPALAAPEASPQAALSLSKLENRLAEIENNLTQLAHYSLRSGIGAIGYRSSWRGESADQTQWVEIDLGKTIPIDEVVLVPAIWRDTEKGFLADGFPIAFRIVVGTGTDRTGTVVAEIHSTENHLPRIAPLAVPVFGTTASWVRVEATERSPRIFDGERVFQLSELLVFSGEENVALRRPAKALSSNSGSAGAWHLRFLTDGLMPYLMNSAQGSQSRAYMSQIGEQPALTLDLGSIYSISRIHLHAADQSGTVPQAYAGDLGIPYHLKIEGANHADFSDAEPLLISRRESIKDTGPIMMWNIPATDCRYIRIAEMSPEIGDSGNVTARIGFAEIELFSKGRNIALGKPVSAIENLEIPTRSLEALTDGNNVYGKILTTRQWINELALRHELESELPRVTEELALRYARQKRNLRILAGLTALLAVTVVISILIERLIYQRKLLKMRNRFAADLHDELGANLHVIGLLGDLAQKALQSPEKLQHLHQRIRTMTERSGIAVRECTNMLEAELFGDLIEDMQRSTLRIMADQDGELTFVGEKYLSEMKPQRRADLFLFYKECLVNISRHSGATRFSAELTATPKEISLIVSDNGYGKEDSISSNRVPKSLKRRARLLRAHVSVGHPSDGGTYIKLKFKIRKRLFPKVGKGRKATSQE